jgi:hypothetical protein
VLLVFELAVHGRPQYANRYFFHRRRDAGYNPQRTKGGSVLKESASNLIQPTELETIVAILRKRVEQVKVMLPKDVAFDIAQNVRSNARTLDLGLNRLMAHSSVNTNWK